MAEPVPSQRNQNPLAPSESLLHGLPIAPTLVHMHSAPPSPSMSAASPEEGDWRDIYDRIEAMLPRVEALNSLHARLLQVNPE